MLKRLILVWLFSAPLFFVSCEKEKEIPPTNTQLLTEASWKFSSATVSGTDISNQLQACQKDNTYTFNSSGSGIMDEGATKCNAADPQTRPTTWTFTNGETTLNLSNPLFSGGSTSLTIVSLTSTQLVVSFPYTPPVGAAVTVTATFIH